MTLDIRGATSVRMIKKDISTRIGSAAAEFNTANQIRRSSNFWYIALVTKVMEFAIIYQ